MTDGIVEGEAEGLVRLFATLAAIEQVRLDVLEDGEEYAARLVGRDVTVGAGNALGNGSCQTRASVCRIWEEEKKCSPLATVARATKERRAEKAIATRRPE